MEQKEIWKIWYNGPKVIWQVSNYGNVKKNGIPYECKLDKNGYKFFGGGLVHRAVAKLFIPNPNNYSEVDHINGDKLDNRAINLQWCTHQQNLNNPITLKRRSEAMIQWFKEHPDAQKGKNNHNYGKTQSEETRKRQSEGMKIYWQNKKLNKSL